MDGDGMIVLSGAAALAVGGLLSAMSLAIVGMWRRDAARQVEVVAAMGAHIKGLERELTICQQEKGALLEAMWSTIPVLQKQSEVAADAFNLAKRRGAA